MLEQRVPMVRANFGAFDMMGSMQRHFYRFGKIAGGAEVRYDGAAGARVDETGEEQRAPGGQRWGLGMYGGYEHVIGRFGALVHVGSTVARGFEAPDARRLYARYGWRYQINDRVWAILAVRSDGLRRANLLAYGIGYRLRRGR